MKDDTVTRYVLSDGKITEIKIPRSESMNDITRTLEKDKDFLDIMAKM
ncbi:MAG: hypothetical protein GQ533_09720 [Methanosarcinaceae archaeon]|jgi:hypothetical protein|nr:hypothetical protein [Methanosarcinaceae archaeon]